MIRNDDSRTRYRCCCSVIARTCVDNSFLVVVASVRALNILLNILLNIFSQKVYIHYKDRSKWKAVILIRSARDVTGVNFIRPGRIRESDTCDRGTDSRT